MTMNCRSDYMASNRPRRNTENNGLIHYFHRPNSTADHSLAVSSHDFSSYRMSPVMGLLVLANRFFATTSRWHVRGRAYWKQLTRSRGLSRWIRGNLDQQPLFDLIATTYKMFSPRLGVNDIFSPDMMSLNPVVNAVPVFPNQQNLHRQ